MTLKRSAWPERFGSGLVVAPGAYDALSARLIVEAGYGAVYMSGGCISVAQLGHPDLGVLAATDVERAAESIVDAVDVPVIVDIDTGFGSPLNGYRTARRLRQLGVAALQIEDQTAPKRCGHLAGKSVVDVDEFCERLAAVIEGADGKAAVIARTDALASDGLDEALERGQRYREAGADLVFVEAPEAKEDFSAIGSAFEGTCVANMVAGGRSPNLTVAELESMGFALVIFPSVVINGAIAGARRNLLSLRAMGTDADSPFGCLPPTELFELAGLSTTTVLLERWSRHPIAPNQSASKGRSS